jgi:chromosome segregation ATPase
VGVGGVLIGRYILGPGGDSRVASLLEEKTQELESKNKNIEDLDRDAEQLRKELEESAKQVADLQSRLDQTNRGLASMQERLKMATRSSSSPSAGSGSGRAAEAGSYETVRDTSVYADTSTASSKVAKIPKGTKVNVVGSSGDWLEVRSKYGKPPGYIRREDAMYIGPN